MCDPGGADIYVYGEGWNFGEVAGDARFAQATQANMAGTGVGTFNDRLRDAVRGGRGDDPEPEGSPAVSGRRRRSGCTTSSRSACPAGWRATGSPARRGRR